MFAMYIIRIIIGELRKYGLILHTMERQYIGTYYICIIPKNNVTKK